MIVRTITLCLGAVFLALAFSDDPRIAGGPGFGLTELVLLAAGITNVMAALLGGGIMVGWMVCQVMLVFTLGVAELALRATVAHRYISPYQLDERYLYELVPGVLYEHRHMAINGGSQLYRVNSQGFRGEELATAAQPRVVIYGDSFIHAEYTALENTLAAQLSDRLTAATGGPVEVINGGVAGYGPDQVLRRVQDELEWLEPDLLIVAVFTGNDFGDLLRNKLYRLDDDGNLVANEYRLSEEIRLNAALEQSDPMLRKVGRRAKDSIQMLLQGGPPPVAPPLQRTEDRLQQHIREYDEYIVNRDNVVYDLRTDPYSADIALLPDSDSAQYKLQLMDAVVGAISMQAEKHSVPLLVLAIPHPMDIMGGEHASGAVDTAKYPDYRPAVLTDSIAAIGARRNIDTINLYPEFRAIDDPAGLYLLGGDDHWNNAGQSLAADIIAAHIMRNGYLQR